jgi:putative flippase GtrA
MSQTLPRLDEEVGYIQMRALADDTMMPELLEDVGAPVSALRQDHHSPTVDLVIPVFNEEHILEASITRLRAFLNESFPFDTVIRIIDNASTDGTWEAATRLAADMSGVTAEHLIRKGRGLALRSAWSSSTAEIVAYMDVDLSTDLAAFLPLVAPLLSGRGDVAIGSRLARGAHVVRGPKRELISRAYNLLLKIALRGHFSDAQCGFKALRRESAVDLLPIVEDDEWFFDTELLIAAERLGMRICEVPVDWVDDPDSRVKIWRTAMSDLRGVWRITHGRARRLTRRFPAQTRRPPAQGGSAVDQVAADQLLRFAGIGTVSFLAYLLLFMTLRPAVGSFGANALALAICTLPNLAVHRELARRMQGPARRGRFAGLAAALFATSLVLTTLALVGAYAVAASSLPVLLLAVIFSNGVAALLRFSVLRSWVFRPGFSR